MSVALVTGGGRRESMGETAVMRDEFRAVGLVCIVRRRGLRLEGSKLTFAIKVAVARDKD